MLPTLGQQGQAGPTSAVNSGPAGASWDHIHNLAWASRGSLGHICRHSWASLGPRVDGMADMQPDLGQQGPVGATSAVCPGAAQGSGSTGVRAKVCNCRKIWPFGWLVADLWLACGWLVADLWLA